mgnify:CR=1 FL=1
MRSQMIRVREHIEVYDQWGGFLFSADTEEEALSDLALMPDTQEEPRPAAPAAG